jgi:uncharacterized protein YdaU (DUF1376 family)
MGGLMHIYRHHIGDYDSATAHLDWTEDMAYTRLLRLYYKVDGNIPKEAAAICRLIRATSRAEKAAVDIILGEFFTLTEEGWKNKRADEEIAEYQARAEKNRLHGKKGGRPSTNKTNQVNSDNPDGFDMETQMVSEKKPTKNQEPRTNNQDKNTAPATAVAVLNPNNQRIGPKELIAKVPDLLPQIADDFLTVRKAKRAPLTATALALIESEAVKAGITTAQAIAISTARGWQSFKAEWIQQSDGKTHAERTQDYKDRKAAEFFEPLLTMTDEEKREWGFA